jgi:hypothetical protein
MFVIIVPPNEDKVSSKLLYFVEERYTFVWTTIYTYAKKFTTKELAEAEINKLKLKGVEIREV